MPVPRRTPTPLANLIEIARGNLPTISGIWDFHVGNMVRVLNDIRRLFNLATQAEAAELHRQAVYWSQTPLGQSALGATAAIKLSDIPIDPNMRSPFGESSRVKYTVSFEFDDEHYSFQLYGDGGLTAGELSEAVSDFLSDHIDLYPFIEKAIHSGAESPADIRIRKAVRKY